MDKYPGYKKFFVDTETTGTDRNKHNIFQISGRIIDIDGTVLEKFNFKFRPISIEDCDPGALEKTGMTVDDLKNLPLSAAEAYTALIEILSKHVDRFNKKDKMQLIAYNAKFDSEFIREFFSKMNDNYYGSWFWTPAICVMESAAMFLIDVRGAIRDFKLGTICDCAGLGWDESKAHDADYDIEQTIKLFNFIRENTRILGE